MARVQSRRKSAAEAPQKSTRKSRGKRYGQEKQVILEKAIAELGAGGQITKVADKLGVTFFTLKAWLKEKGVTDFSEKAKPKRGRPAGKKKLVAPSEPSAPKTDAVATKKSPKITVSAKDKPDYVRELERKIEELIQKTKKLSHLYGELRSEVGND